MKMYSLCFLVLQGFRVGTGGLPVTAHLRTLLLIIPKNTKKEKTGDFLISQAASRQVSSALESLTSVFGMGTGVSSLL